MTMECPLCHIDDDRAFSEDRLRTYRRCNRCALVFVPPRYHLCPEDEKQQYDLHDNDPSDTGYRTFLGRLFEPLRARLNPGAEGLDFGSGPGPTLSGMFEQVGHPMALYDPFYANDPSVFDRTYDFITATEVVEHLYCPGDELDRLFDRLKPGGLLGIMTQCVPELGFDDWGYIRDDAHVCFFSNRTFEWLAKRWNASLTVVRNDVMVIQKSTN